MLSIVGNDELAPVAAEVRDEARRRRRTRSEDGRHCLTGLMQVPWCRDAQTATAARASANRSAAKSRSSIVCAEDICVRMRAVPRGTTGKEKLTA